MKRTTLTVVIVFALGLASGLALAKKQKFEVSSTMYRGQTAAEAGATLLGVSLKQAREGSWERIAVARVHYLAGQKDDAEAIFTSLSRQDAADSDLFRIGRTYAEAGDWDKARAVFERVVEAAPDDEDWLAEIGAWSLLAGDREWAEELFDRSFSISSTTQYNSAKAAGAYLGVNPF